MPAAAAKTPASAPSRQWSRGEGRVRQEFQKVGTRPIRNPGHPPYSFGVEHDGRRDLTALRVAPSINEGRALGHGSGQQTAGHGDQCTSSEDTYRCGTSRTASPAAASGKRSPSRGVRHTELHRGVRERSTSRPGPGPRGGARRPTVQARAALSADVGMSVPSVCVDGESSGCARALTARYGRHMDLLGASTFPPGAGNPRLRPLVRCPKVKVPASGGKVEVGGAGRGRRWGGWGELEAGR